MSKINIRESLKHMDEDTFCKYDLTTMYDSCVLDDEDKKVFAKMLYDKEDPEVIYQKLCMYFDDDQVADIDSYLMNVPVEGKYESLINKCVNKLSESYKDVSYNDVANQLEFNNGEQAYVIGVCPFEDVDTDDYEVFIDYNYDSPCCFNSEDEALKYILNFIKNKVNYIDDSDIQNCDDEMVYTVYDIVEDDNRLVAKCMNESTNDFEDIKLGKTNTNRVIELINNLLNNPNYKVTKETKDKIYKNSAPWGLAVQMTPSVDVEGTNGLLATGNFGGEASFGESLETNFEKDDRVTDGSREGTVLDSDSQKVLVEWDYSETDDIEWVDKSTLELVSETNSGFLPNMEYCPACGGTHFNVKTGVCIDCGYNEGDWGYTSTDDYDDLDESKNIIVTGKEARKYLDNKVNNTSLENSNGYWKIQKDLASGGDLTIVNDVDDVPRDYKYRFSFDDVSTGTTLNMDAYNDCFNWYIVDYSSDAKLKESVSGRYVRFSYNDIRNIKPNSMLKESSRSNYNIEDGWTEEDINLHKSIDWKSRNYEEYPVTTDSFQGHAVVYGLPEPITKNVTMIKYLRPNPIFPPYYAPKENPFKEYSNVVGPMYDGRKHGSYQIHNRYETQELYDTFFESVVNNDKSKIKMFDCPRCHNKTLVDIDNYVTRNADVDYHDQFVCEECGAELLSEPQFDGTIRFITESNRDKYSDYDEIDYNVAKVLGLNESLTLKESVNSDIVSMIRKQFPKATIRTSVRKHSDVHKSNPDTPRGKSKYVDIRITPDSASSVNSILQYCNHNLKKILDSDNRFYYYGDTPARNPRGSKEVILSYEDYSDLSDDEYNSMLGESKSINEDALDDQGISKTRVDIIAKQAPNSKFYIDKNRYVLGKDLLDYFNTNEILTYSSYETSDGIRVLNSYKIINRVVDESKSIKEDLKKEFKKQLQDELYDKFIDLARTPEWGFENLAEIDDYLMPTIDINDYEGEYDNDIEVEFRAEVNYREMEDVCNTLDKVVKKYDKYAYFEPVQPGIAVAYLKFPKRLKEDFEDDPQAELTLEIYNKVKRGYEKEISKYESISSKSTKNEGIFKSKKTKQNEYADAIKVVFGEDSNVVSNKVISATSDLLQEIADACKDKNSANNFIKVIKNAKATVNKTPHSLVKNIISLGQKYQRDSVNLEELKEFISKVGKLQNSNKDGYKAMKFLFNKVNTSLLTRLDAITKHLVNEFGLVVETLEASYGGAFDIEDDQYFTKEDIMDLADEVCERLYKEVHETFDISDLYMDGNTLHMELESDSCMVETDVKIDMRKIRKPLDIMKYALPITNKLLSQVKDCYNY